MVVRHEEHECPLSPARTPQEFVKALRKHNLSEMGHFPGFLPDLYWREVKLEG
jgi:hypothetical protein